MANARSRLSQQPLAVLRNRGYVVLCCSSSTNTLSRIVDSLFMLLDDEQYRTVLNTVDDAIYMTDENRRFTWVNEASERMFGYDRDSMIGTPLFDYLDDEQIETAKENVRYLLADDTPNTITFEMEVSTKDGSTIPTETRASLLPGEGFPGTAGVVRDISDRNERQRTLERQKERLDKFTRIVSHDLRNPLNVAEGRLRLAREECDSEHLEALKNAHDRMSTLVDDLITLARAGESLIDVERVELDDVVETSWQNVETASVTLVCQTTSSVKADEGQLHQLLENLFRNGIEHGKADTIIVGDLDDKSGFFVEDNGTGIPEDDRHNVFEWGYTTGTDGTGFGLAIVQEIVEAHDWEIAVGESETGGARFEIAGIS